MNELNDVTVKIFTNKKPPTVSADMPLSKAADKMLREKVHSVVVLDNGKPVGVVSSWDIVKTSFIAEKAKEMPVSKLIEGQHLYFVFEEVSLRDALNLMVDKNINSLPILNESEELVGMVRLFDIAKFIREKL